MSKKKKHQKQINTEQKPEEAKKKPLKMPEITMTFDAMFSSALQQMLDESEPDKKQEKPQKKQEAFPVVVLPEKKEVRHPEQMPPPIRPEENTYLDEKVEQALLNFVSAEEAGNEAVRSYQEDLSETEIIPPREPASKPAPVPDEPEPVWDEPEPVWDEPEPVWDEPEPVQEAPCRTVPDRPQPEAEFDLPAFMERTVPLHETQADEAPERFEMPEREPEHEPVPEMPAILTVPDTPESDAPEAPERFEVPEQTPEQEPEQAPEADEPKEKEHSGWFRHRKKSREQTKALPEQAQTAPEDIPVQEDEELQPQEEDTDSLLMRVYSLLGDTDRAVELPPVSEAKQPDLSQTIRFSAKQEQEQRHRSTEQTVRIPAARDAAPAPIREELPHYSPLPPLKEPEQPPEKAEQPEPVRQPEESEPVDFWQEFAELKTLVMSSPVPPLQDEAPEAPETVPEAPKDEAPEAASEDTPGQEEAPEAPDETPAERQTAQHRERFGFFRSRREKQAAAPQPEELQEVSGETQDSSEAQDTQKVPEAPQAAPEQAQVPAQEDLSQPEPERAEPAQTEPAKAEPEKAEPETAEPAKAEPEKTEPVRQSAPRNKHLLTPGTSAALAAAASLLKSSRRAAEPTVIQSADAKAAPETAEQTQPEDGDLQFLQRRRSAQGTERPDSTRKKASGGQDVLRPDEAFRSYSRKLGATGTRLVLAVFVTLLSLFFTLYGSFGWTFLPQKGNLAFTDYVLLALLLITAAMAFDVFKDAAQRLKKMQFSAAALVALALLAVVFDTVHAAATGRVAFCTVASLPVIFLLWDRYDGVTGILTTLRTVRDAKEPKGIVEVHDVMKGRVGLSRAEGSVDDFMSKYETQPPTEKLMQIYAPVAAVVCVIASAVIASKSGTPFFWTLELLLLGSIPLIGILNFSRLFCILSKRLRASDVALCGWYGAETFGDEHSILVGDADLFPESNIKFNGIKMISPSADRVIGYAAAAMQSVNSVLYPLFEEELRSRNARHYRVDRYRFYESGGIGAQIAGDIVLMGTLDFMKRMGVHMESGMKLRRAVYTSVNGELAAVFAIKYTPKESVRRGLAAIASNRHFRTIFVTQDFLLTPELIREKYGISLNNTAYPPIKERIRLSETEFKEKGKQGALMADESFGSFADAAAGGRVLKSAVKFCMLLALFNGILGAALMGVLACMSGFEAATALNLLLYELIWMLPTLLLTGWTRRY